MEIAQIPLLFSASRLRAPRSGGRGQAPVLERRAGPSMGGSGSAGSRQCLVQGERAMEGMEQAKGGPGGGYGQRPHHPWCGKMVSLGDDGEEGRDGV